MKRIYCVYNKTRESFLGLNVSCAETSFSRLRGLLGKIRLDSDEGLWVVPSHGVHTIGLLFPIDILYLDKEHKVIDLAEHVDPFRIPGLHWKCESVLQLAPHTIYSSYTTVGDQLVICPPEEITKHLGQKITGKKHA